MTIDPLQLSFALCIGLTFICVYLTLWIRHLKNKMPTPEIRYIDTSGISENPPRQFVEVWQYKTLNFKCDGYIVCIPRVPAMEAMKFLSVISMYFLTIDEMIEMKKANNALQENRTVKQKIAYLINEKVTDIRMMRYYTLAALALYRLSVKNVNRKKGYLKALINKTKTDYAWTLDVLEQINDYWQTIDKKKNLLKKGITLKQMDGYNSTWQGLRLDKRGNKLTVPIYG